ncbi:MAG: NADH-quinone oxidoreductase subunit N, partial [Gemmatimonadetes bacterium]|nr:NADH-quinone oxidoreductase subunit N [Gemmatimonadota bacterium]
MLLDFSSGMHYMLAMAPEVVLSVVGMVVLVAGVSKRQQSGAGEGMELGWFALGGILLAALANGWLYFGVTEASPSQMIALDPFRLFANWILLLGGGFSIVVSLAYVDRHRLQAGEYYSLILFAIVGMMVMASARDLMLIFIGLELMSVGIYALAGFNRRDRRSAEAGLKYFLLGAFASGFLLFGIALTYGGTGSTNIHTIALAIESGAVQNALLIPGIALLAMGFAFKVSAVPFHMWTPDVYEGAPSPVTGFMAASVKAAAFVAFLRVFLVGLGGAYETWWSILWWLAAITMIAANLIALAQSNVKRMLAYSSIAHGGYLLVALVAA